MANKPKNIEKATDQDLEALFARGGGSYKWDFPDEVFNGEWWKIEVANDQVKSAGNSFRNQAKAVYNRKANVHHKDGKIIVRMKDEPATIEGGDEDE